MTRRPNSDKILDQIRSCLDAAVSQPGLVRASVHQTEGYLRGLQGLAWETPALITPLESDLAACFLHAVRSGEVPLRGRIKEDSAAAADLFLKGLSEGFPGAGEKPFSKALSRLWVRWVDFRPELSQSAGQKAGEILKTEYEEGVAGELSGYILDDRLHLRPTRDYLMMRGWLQGTIEHLRRKADWQSRERADLLSANFASIILRALHNANVDYAAEAVAKMPTIASQLDRAIDALSRTEPEASHFLRKNRQTILTRALHSGYFSYPEEAARDLPQTLRALNDRIGKLEHSSPEAARSLRDNVPALIYRALTNGKLEL